MNKSVAHSFPFSLPVSATNPAAELRRLLTTWSGLAAWGDRARRFARTRVVLSSSYVSCAGRAQWGRRDGDWKIVVFARYNEDWHDFQSTLLHEMAHVATMYERADHGRRWRAAYIAAAAEVSGRDPSFFGVGDEVASPFTLDYLVRTALEFPISERAA